jgi:O-antigen ligase
MRRILEPPGEAPPVPGLLGGESAAIQWGRLFVVIVVGAWAVAPLIGYIASLQLLMLVAFAAAFFGFGRPAIGVLGVTLLCTLDPVARVLVLSAGGLLRWNTFNYLLLAVMAFSAAFLWRVADPHSRLLKVFVLALAVGLIFSPDVPNGVEHVLGVTSMFGLLVYLAQAGEDADLWYMVGVVSGTAGALGGLMFLLLKHSLPYVNTNVFALFPETAVFAVCLAFRYVATRPGRQVTLGSLAGANAMWAFLSGSRGGILIVSVGLLFILVSTKRATHRLIFLGAAVLIGTIALSTFDDMETSSLHRISKMLDTDQSAASRTSGRSDLAIAGLYMVGRAPLGVGTGGFAPTWANLGFVPGLSNFKRGQEFQAHSAWIKVLAENGWPGLVLMAAYVASFAFCGFKIRHEVAGSLSLGLLVTTALTVAFLSTEFQGKAVWILAAGATAQLHPVEMARCLAADVKRFVAPPHRLVSEMAHASRAVHDAE